MYIFSRFSEPFSHMNQSRDNFTGFFAVVLAAAGSAIGLGNIWRFPYVMGMYGGGAFLLVYLLFVLGLGVPLMLSEFAIGRRSQSNLVRAFVKSAPGTRWHYIGIMGIVASLLILAFYTTIAGWTLEYTVKMVAGAFRDADAAAVDGMLTQFISQPVMPLLYQALFLATGGWIVMKGVQKGIETFSKILMPILALLLLVLAVRSLLLEGASEGLAFMFKPDFSKLSLQGILNALGQAFFSLSLGMGCLLTYGSYIKREDVLLKTSLTVVFFDSFFAVAAGVIIFPAVFSFGIAPNSGVDLIFKTLPMVFQLMPYGTLFGTLFFVLIMIAALTSIISLLEVGVSCFAEETGTSRTRATLGVMAVVMLLGVLATWSFGPLKDFAPGGKTFFGWFDYLTANVLLPLGAMAISLFVGWYWTKKASVDELTNGTPRHVRHVRIFFFVIRYVAPLAILAIFLSGVAG